MVDPDIASQGSSFKQSVSRTPQEQLSLPSMPSTAAKIAHDPGGKVRLKVRAGIMSQVVFGGEMNEYRYRLSRTWDAKKPHVMFVMMNPSTADPLVDDPTVAKACRFARAWGYGGIFVGNTFAYRVTDQRQLMKVADPIGPDNDAHLIAMAREAKVVVFAYGKPHKQLRYRGLAVMRLLVEEARIKPYVLRLSKDGTPCHPLYLPETLTPVVWNL